MAQKTDAEVIIGGRVFTLSGYESEEYLQRIASYLNGKVTENSSNESFKKLPNETQAVLIELNIADDFFKAKKQIEELESQLENKDKELYDIKHELIATQIKLENMERNLKKAQEESAAAHNKQSSSQQGAKPAK